MNYKNFYLPNKVIHFSKMHGLGNDFVIINNIDQNIKFSTMMIRELSNRNTGIGFDQLLIVETPINKKFDFYYRIFNADGSEVEQCGNGARCFAYFVYLKKITHKKKILVQTVNSSIKIQIINQDNIIVNMGQPTFNINNNSLLSLSDFQLQKIKFNYMQIPCGIICIGNPHCVIIVKDLDKYPINDIGDFLNNDHRLFPNGINVNFVQLISPQRIILRVYERGVGETQACGTGACAAVVYGYIQNFLDSKVLVNLLGGNLTIQWNGLGSNIYMYGPARHVYDGYLNYNFCYDNKK